MLLNEAVSGHTIATIAEMFFFQAITAMANPFLFRAHCGVMAAISINDLQRVKLKKAPPPKVPLGTTASKNGDLHSDTGGVSVAAFRNRFEQKQTPPAKVHAGSFPRQDGGRPSDENVMSVTSARAKFEQKSTKTFPAAWKQSLSQRNGSQNNNFHKQEENRRVFKGEPPRKELPPFFRIGAAPGKKPKPANLKFSLHKYRDKIVLSNAGNNALQTPTEGRMESKLEFYIIIVCITDNYMVWPVRRMEWDGTLKKSFSSSMIPFITPSHLLPEIERSRRIALFIPDLKKNTE